SNHLGNVMAVIGDHLVVESDTVRYPFVFSLNDYYVFGAKKELGNSSAYRYGFNGKENDNEVKGEGNQQDYGMRIYDPRLGKFLSVDPLSVEYPWYTPYQFAGNTPIQAVDLDGAEEFNYNLKIDEETGKAKLELISIHSGLLFNLTVTQYVSYKGKRYSYGIEWNIAPYKSFGHLDDLNGKTELELDEHFSKRMTTYDEQVAKQGYDDDIRERAWAVATGIRYAKNVQKARNYEKNKAYSSHYLYSTARERVAARISGLRDRNSGSYKAYFFGSRNNNKNREDSDLDLLIITENPSFFSRGRGANILNSIKNDYKKTTGVDLDINIMTPKQYNSAKDGEFKKSVESNSTEIKIK
uniref:RHS repeat-associated core domain-containing protein n=1 Tax=Gynurincola endophyticus TaxID=2479004 RepID=UPI0018F4309D